MTRLWYVVIHSITSMLNQVVLTFEQMDFNLHIKFEWCRIISCLSDRIRKLGKRIVESASSLPSIFLGLFNQVGHEQIDIIGGSLLIQTLASP
jgi:hypothetical protein